MSACVYELATTSKIICEIKRVTNSIIVLKLYRYIVVVIPSQMF